MAMGWIKARCLHVKSIGKPWWLLVEGAWGAFWTADAMIVKYGSQHVKDVWDKYTLHVFFDWRTGVIGLLAITLLLVIEGSFRYARRLKPPDLAMAEEDPKVHLDPLNDEFPITGMIPFDLFNEGQRVNPAYRITVQPIPLLPSVSFEYVDHLKMAEHKKIIPQIKTGLLEHNNLLALLLKACEGVDRLPFETAITYEDATGTRKFQTTVSLEYWPSEHDAAIAELTMPNRATHEILKVTDTDFRRLS